MALLDDAKNLVSQLKEVVDTLSKSYDEVDKEYHFAVDTNIGSVPDQAIDVLGEDGVDDIYQPEVESSINSEIEGFEMNNEWAQHVHSYGERGIDGIAAEDKNSIYHYSQGYIEDLKDAIDDYDEDDENTVDYLTGILDDAEDFIKEAQAFANTIESLEKSTPWRVCSYMEDLSWWVDQVGEAEWDKLVQEKEQEESDE